MNVVDSCGWIEYFTNSPYAGFYASPIEEIENLIVPVICLVEVFKKIRMEKSESAALTAVAHMRQGKVVPLTESIGLKAASLGIEYQLPLADSIIHAVGVITDSTVYTQDAHFRGLRNVEYLEIKG